MSVDSYNYPVAVSKDGDHFWLFVNRKLDGADVAIPLFPSGACAVPFDWQPGEMADQGSIDDLLSKDIDQNKVTALVGSLESQLASSAGKDSHKILSGSSFNNNHIGGNASVVNVPNSTLVVVATPQQTVLNVQSLGTQPQVIASNKVAPNNSTLVNSAVKGNVNNSQIIGISSIINPSSLNRTNSSVTISNPSQTAASLASKQINTSSSPSIRIVTNNSKPQNSVPHTPIQVSNAQFFNSTLPQSAAMVRQPQPLARVNISATGASTAMHNLATIAAEQKPLTVLPNGSTHLQSVQNKDGSMIPQQIIVKSDANHTVVKRELSPLVKNVIPMTNSVIQGLTQVVRQPGPIITSGSQQLIKGTTNGNPSVVTVQAHPPISQQHVVVRATVATTLANSSPAVQVVNASAAGNPTTIRPAVAPQIRPGQVRIQQPNLAPRQPTSQTVS